MLALQACTHLHPPLSPSLHAPWQRMRQCTCHCCVLDATLEHCNGQVRYFSHHLWTVHSFVGAVAKHCYQSQDVLALCCKLMPKQCHPGHCLSIHRAGMVRRWLAMAGPQVFGQVAEAMRNVIKLHIVPGMACIAQHFAAGNCTALLCSQDLGVAVCSL